MPASVPTLSQARFSFIVQHATFIANAFGETEITQLQLFLIRTLLRCSLLLSLSSSLLRCCDVPTGPQTYRSAKKGTTPEYCHTGLLS